MALRSPYVLQVFSTEGLTATAFVATLNTEELGWLCAWEDQSTRKSARLQCLHPHPAPGAAITLVTPPVRIATPSSPDYTALGKHHALTSHHARPRSPRFGPMAHGVSIEGPRGLGGICRVSCKTEVRALLRVFATPSPQTHSRLTSRP